jgi:hypothetical protein
MSTGSEDSEAFFVENFILDEDRISRGRRKLRQVITESLGQTSSRLNNETSVLSTVGDQMMRRYGSKPGKGRNRNRRRAEGALLLNRDYFMDNSTYDDVDFQRRFRVPKPVFLRLLSEVCRNDPYFLKKKDALGRSWTFFRAKHLCMSANACVWYCGRLFRPVFQNR